MVKKNYYRLSALLVGVIAIELFFLLYVERVRLVNNTHDLVLVSYILHSMLAVFALLILLVMILYKSKANIEHPVIRRVPMLATFIVLILSSVIAVFDQVTTGHITLFSIHLLSFGLLIYIKPFKGIYIYGIPFGIFLIGVLLFQQDSSLELTHLINGTIIYVGVIFASTTFYQNNIKEHDFKQALVDKNAELKILSTIDPLTKLANRRLFERQVTYEASINRRYNHQASLLLIDIDHFKAINDTHGHDAGDFILKELATMLKSSVRESDTVARFGGEEFMLLLSHTDIEGATILAKRINRLIENHTYQYLDHMIT
ncbi:MAG: GGDEF domain-containing protein, partial [Bacillota bacterium]